jgi:hypothetical protein
MLTTTIPATVLQADLAVLEATQRRFRQRALAARKRGARAEAVELDTLALLFGRVVNVYRQAHRITEVSWQTSDKLPAECNAYRNVTRTDLETPARVESSIECP